MIPFDMSIDPSTTGPMAYARWYASMVALGNGQLVALGGRDENSKFNGYSEIYTDGVGWRTLTGAYIEEFNNASNYPRTWVASDGKLITFAAEYGNATVYAIDPTGSGSVDVGWKAAIFNRLATSGHHVRRRSRPDLGPRRNDVDHGHQR